MKSKLSRSRRGASQTPQLMDGEGTTNGGAIRS